MSFACAVAVVGFERGYSIDRWAMEVTSLLACRDSEVVESQIAPVEVAMMALRPLS